MADSNEKLQAGFLRARRLIIAIGLALAFTKVLGIQFTKINLLGNEAEIPHPGQVIWILWCGWGWAFVQYLVWFKDVGALNELGEAVTKVCGDLVGALVLEEDLPEWVQSDLAQDLTHRNAQKAPEQFKFHSEFTTIDLDSKNKSRVANVETYAYCMSPTGRGRTMSQTVRWETEISDDMWRQYFLRAWLEVLLTSRFMLEYFAPIVIGLLPIVVALFMPHHAQLIRPCHVHQTDCFRI